MSKINLSVDISELFFEVEQDEGVSEFSLDEILKKVLLDEVRSQVRNLAREEIKAMTEKFINDDLLIEVRSTMKAFLHDFLINKKLQGKYGDKTANQILESQFDNEIGRYDSIGKAVGQLAEKWGATLKSQYDAAFATKIVHKLNQEGLLIPSAAQLLLSNNS